jgi:hypothetical protein
MALTRASPQFDSVAGIEVLAKSDPIPTSTRFIRALPLLVTAMHHHLRY